MLNKDPENKRRRNVYVPEIVYAKPGDKVIFKPVDRGHNSQSIKKMTPNNVKWNSRINQEFELTVEKAGVYGYKCTPHYAMGMVGLIVVEGDGLAESLEAAKKVKHRGKSRGVMKDLLAEVETKVVATN